MQLSVVGPAYQDVSTALDNQRCVNYFLHKSNSGEVALLPTPGLALFCSIPGTEARAIINVFDQLYAVVDDKVYRLVVNDAGTSATPTLLGTIDTTTGPVKWASNPTQIILGSAGSASGYIITIATDAFAQISDPDFTGLATVAFMDGYFIYNTPNSSTMYATAINDGTTISALDVVTAEGRPDKLLAVVVDKRELWAIGTKSVEIWTDTANATGFPFSIRGDVFLDQGCSATYSVANVNNTLMWLDDRRWVVQVSQYQLEPVSSDALKAEFQSYAVVDDAIAYTHTVQGHQFYVITFPTEEKTWAYDFNLKVWHERAFYDSANARLTYHKAQYRETYMGKDIVCGKQSGNIYIMDSSYYTDDDVRIKRIRTTSHFRKEFVEHSVKNLVLRIDNGIADQSGDDSDPQMLLRYSLDGGHTWSYEMSEPMGKVGEYGKLVNWNRLGNGRQWLFEFSTAAAIKHALLDASVEV